MKYKYLTLYYSGKKVLVNFDKVEFVEPLTDPEDKTREKCRVYFSIDSYIFIEVRESIMSIGEYL